MATNQDKVDSVLNKMEQENDPQALSQGLNILCKLTSNIIKQPFEQKYRGIKTTNNTIKNKIMSLRGIEDLIATLGFSRQSQEMFNLGDQHFYIFIEGQPALDYRRRLVAARLSSPADYQKELLLIKTHKQQKAMQQKKEEEAKKLKDLAKYDYMERKHMKVDDSKSRELAFGSNTKTCQDMGIGVKGKGNKGSG